MKKLRGVLAALATPFDDRGAVDLGAVRELTESMIASGVHGLVPCGSTGEFASLTVEERRRIVEAVAQQARGRVPVVPHVAALSTALAVELARHAVSVGADGVLAVQPFYEPLSLNEVFAYYEAISDAAGIPVVAYNLPAATGVNLTPAFLAKMALEIEHFAYVKDTSGDLGQISELVYRHGHQVGTLIGQDDVVFLGFVAGCIGSIWGAPNFLPAQCASLFDLCEAGRLDEARALWARLWPVQRFLITEGYVASVKAGMKLCGFQAGVPRLPVHPLSPAKEQELAVLLAAAGALPEAR